ncbi:replication factor A protein 2 [Puccinia graminis f. sp. tritici]|uniref:Replication factor A protein 2 n=1 Tax=Puccinia graminis f. sp. tritici TaxID=56615 RepID=A0A5B0PSV4_PUCGR|nr:replication factor A protein 2 [Puccinia graminis f. sp. tritici]
MSTYASGHTDGHDYGGGGGGGFMQGTQNNNTPGGTRGVEQSLRPVTIKQLLDAKASNTDSAIAIQDIDVTNVRILLLSSCSFAEHNYSLVSPQNLQLTTLTPGLVLWSDGTGGIEVRKWIDSSDGESEGFEAETGIQIRDWVRVIGSPKLFNNKKTVAGLRVEKITDFNEINYRLLDAVRVTLAYERGATGAGDEMNIDQSTNHTTHGKIIQAKIPSRTPKQNKIMEYFASVQPPAEGINIHDIARQCNLDVKEVIDETAELIHEGELFTTVDDEQYVHLLHFHGRKIDY